LFIYPVDFMKKLYRAHRLTEVPDKEGMLINPYLNMARRPRDTSRELHEMADAWFEQKFGLRFRSRALFCSGNPHEAGDYCDNEHVLISLEPIGEYAFCYSPNCVDMYRHFKRLSSGRRQQDEVWQELESLEYRLVSNGSWDVAAASGCEITIFAHKFRYSRESL